MSMLELNSWTFSEEQDFVFVAVRGEDAENFLQGMLTQNVKTMGPTDARWTAACNHQGRTAATSLIVRICLLYTSWNAGNLLRLKAWTAPAKALSSK